SHPGVRRQAVRLIGDAEGELPRELFRVLKRRAGDPDPQMQLQVAYTLGQVHESAAATLLGLRLGTSGEDRFIWSALFSSVSRDNFDEVLSAVLRSGNGPVIGELLDMAAALGNDQAVASAVEFMTRNPGVGLREWEIIAFGRLLESLARRNESL